MSDTTPHDDRLNDDRPRDDRPQDDRPQGEQTETITPPPPPPSDPAPPETALDQAPYEQPSAPETPPPPPAPAEAYATPPPPSGQPYPTPVASGPYTAQAPVASPMSPQEEKTWGMLSHVIGAVAMVVSAGFLGFVGSLIIYVMYKDRGPFVRSHAANSLNVQIGAFIGSVIGWILTITIIGAIVGIPILIVTYVGALILHVMGALKANNGEWWDPPMVPKFVR